MMDVQLTLMLSAPSSCSFASTWPCSRWMVLASTLASTCLETTASDTEPQAQRATATPAAWKAEHQKPARIGDRWVLCNQHRCRCCSCRPS